MAVHRGLNATNGSDSPEDKSLFQIISNRRLTCGHQVNIAIFKEEPHRCPACGLRRADGFDVGIEGRWIFGALCSGCDWSC